MDVLSGALGSDTSYQKDMPSSQQSFQMPGAVFRHARSHENAEDTAERASRTGSETGCRQRTGDDESETRHRYRCSGGSDRGQDGSECATDRASGPGPFQRFGLAAQLHLIQHVGVRIQPFELGVGSEAVFPSAIGEHDADLVGRAPASLEEADGASNVVEIREGGRYVRRSAAGQQIVFEGCEWAAVGSSSVPFHDPRPFIRGIRAGRVAPREPVVS